ncbi:MULTISPECIES: helix-turn-helix domain-containing protein [Nocardia]|uniref:preprotein translocase subunit SecA n=1 Tax=Nocardia TaxID=1817 RepID=UPI001357AC76|nr:MULTISPECIES: helix-turn-helix domain-containing protein [Nocardia]
MDGSWSLNPVVELRTLFEGLPTVVRRPIELVVFGGDLPRADVSGMRWMAAELRAKAAAMNGHADDAQTLLAEEDSLGALGDRVREILDLHREGAARLREEALALADQAHAAANDAEKTLCVMFAFGVELAWRIFRTLSAAAAAGPAAQVAAAPVVESMLVEGRGRVALMRAGLEQAYKVGAASTAARLSALGPARFAVTVGTAAALPAGVDLGVQLAQVASGDRNSTVKGPNGENPRGIDLKSVAAAGVSGAGGALGGIAAGMVAPKVFPRLETSRWALGLVQGVAGAVSGLGAAALITGWPEHYEDVLASLLSGGFAGVVDVHRGGHSDLGSPVGKVVDGSVAHVPPDPSTVSLSKDAVMRLTGAPQGTKSLVPAPPAPVDNTGGITPQPANPASPGPATGAGASQAEENSVSSRPPGATGDGQHEPDEAGDRLRHLADSGSGERAPASDAHANGQAGTAGQPGDSNSPARQGDRAAADRVGDRARGVDPPAGADEPSGRGLQTGGDAQGGSGPVQTGDRARGDDGAHGGDMHNDGGAQAGSAGISQTRDGGQADSGGGAQAGNGQAGGGAHGASGGNGQPGGGAHGAGAGAGAQAGRGLASGAVLSSAGGDHSDSGPRQSGDHGEGDAHVTGRGRNVWAPAGDGAAGHEPAVSRPGPKSAKVDPPVEVGDAGPHSAGDEGPARVTAPKQTDIPSAHEPPVEHSADAAPADDRPSVHDAPDRPVGELAQELVGLPSADPATKRDLTAEQQAQFKAAAKKALAVYRLRQEELAGESWEQRRHAMEHGDRAESLLRYIDAVREGTGKTPRWNQIKAFLLGEHGFMRQMGTGQGKSMVGALDTLRQLSRGEPVEAASGKSVRVHHVITTTEVLANEGVREFAPMLRGLGYEVARWDPHDPPGETQRPTVYYMTYDERATAELFDRPPPGKTATIDEADAVLVHNQTVHYQSEGQREIASEVEAAGVHRVRDFLKAVLRSRITAAKDLSMHLEEALHDGPLTVEEAGAVRALSAVEVGAARTLTARLLREQPEQCLDTVSRLWESYAGRKFTAEETEMARAFLDVKAGRLKLDRDFQIFGEDSEKKVQILDEYGKPRSDPKIGTESRWFGGRHKMVEAMFGAPVYSDGTGSKQVTVEDVLGRYEHLHLMSGTLERTAAEIKENFPVEGGLAKVEDFGRSKLAGEQDRIFLTEPEKLRDAVGRVRQLQAAGRPVLVICPFNDLARKFSLMLTKAGVEHNSIDARWFAEHRDNNAAEEHLLSVKDTAGVRGAVTVGTGMLGRGFDVSISDEVNELGGVHAHMLGRSPTNPDEDHQWSARAGRNGRNGSFCFNVAASDRLYSEAQQQGARVAVTHYRAAVAKHAEATAEYTETVRQVGDPDAAQPQKSVQAARTKVAATAADVAAAEREMRSLTTPLQNDAADRTYLQRAMRRANQAHAPPAAEDLAATSPQSTVAADLLHTGPGTAHAAAGVDPTGADPGRTRSDTGHAGADKDRVVMEAVHVGPDAVQPHLRGDRFARLAGWLGIPASVQAAAAMFDTDDDDDPLSRLLERAGVSSAAVEALNQHLDHAAPAVVMRADTLSDEQALNHLMPQRNRLAAELGWEPAQVAGAEGVRQVGAAVDTARKELADLLDVPATEVNTATARDGLADAVARLLAPTETADDPATELLVLAASTYLAVTALLDLAVAIHQRSPKSCVNNGVTMMRVLYPDSEHAYHLPDDMPLRGHDEEDTERAFGGAFRAFGSLDAAAESLKDRPGGSQALVYRWMNKGEVESHLVLLVNDSDRADAPNLVVLDIAAAPGETPITPADLAGRPALLNKAVPFQQWRREQQAFIDRLKEADRAVFAIEFDNKGQPLARLSATQRSAVASRDPGLPPPSLWSSRAPPLRRKMFALAGARPPGDGPSPDSSVPADTTEPDTQSLNVDSGSAMPHDDPESRGTDAGSMQGRVGSRPPAGRDRESTWSAGTAPLDFRTTRAEVHARTGAEVGDGLATLETFVAMRDGAPVHPGGGADAGDLTDEQMAGPALVPEQLLLTQEHADALSDALTERDQAVDRITDQVCELEHVLAALVGESGTVDMVSLTGVRDELNTFLDQQLAAYAETPEGRRDQMIATLRQVTAKPRLDDRDIRVLNEIMPAKHGGLAALLPGARNRYAQALHTAARVRLAELDSHRVDAFRVDDAMRRLQRGIRGQLDHAAEVLFERGSRRTVQGLLDDIDSMRSKISAARRNISAGWHDIPGDGLAPLLSEIARGLRTRDDVVEAVAAIAAPRHIAVIVDDALRMVEQSAVGIFAESSMRGFVFRDQEARRVRALEETVARVRTTVGIPQTAPDLYTRVVDKSAEHRSDLSTFVDPADTLYLHFTPNIRAIATAGMIRSGAHDEIINTTAGHSLGVHFIKPGNWQGTENFNMYVGYAGLRRTLATGNGTVLPDPLGAIVVMPLGAITKTTPIRNEAKTTAPDEAHLASDATFRPLDGNPSYAYPLDDAYIIPCYSNLQVPQEQRLIIDPDTGERNVRPIAEPIRDAFRRAGYEEAWIDRHVIELPERIAADPDTRVLHGEYDRTKRLIRQAQDEIKRRMAEDGTYTDRLVVPLTTEHGRQFETLDLHGTTRQGYHSTSALAIERLIVTDRRPPVGDAEKPRSERTRWTRSDQPDRAPDQQEQRTRPHGLDGPIGSRPSSDVTASEQNRPTPWSTARTEPDQPPIPPASPGDSVPGEDTTGPGEFIGSRPPSPGEAAGRPTPWARHTVPEALIEQPDGSAPAAWPTPNGTEPFRRWSKDARLARGLTQAQLAARMGVPNSATYIGSLERGVTITRDMAVRLLEGLGAPAEVAESVLREYFPDEHGEFPDPRSDRFRHPKDWIIAARTSKGLSRTELAARASVGLTGLSQKERAENPRGEFGMNPDYALRLLAGLDAPGDIATAFMSRFYPDWEAAARADGPRSGGPDGFIGSRPLDDTSGRAGAPADLIGPVDERAGLPTYTPPDAAMRMRADRVLREHWGAGTSPDDLVYRWRRSTAKRAAAAAEECAEHAARNARLTRNLGVEELRALARVWPEFVGKAGGFPSGVRDEANRWAFAKARSTLERAATTRLTGRERELREYLLNVEDLLIRAGQRAATIETPGVPAPTVLLERFDTDDSGAGSIVISFGSGEPVAEAWHVDGTDRDLRRLDQRMQLACNHYEVSVRENPERPVRVVVWSGTDGHRLAGDMAALSADVATGSAPHPADRPERQLVVHGNGGRPAKKALAHDWAARTFGTVVVCGESNLKTMGDALTGIASSTDVYYGIESRASTLEKGKALPGVRFACRFPTGDAGRTNVVLKDMRDRAQRYEKEPFEEGKPIDDEFLLYVDDRTKAPTESLDNMGRILAGRADRVARHDPVQNGRLRFAECIERAVDVQSESVYADILPRDPHSGVPTLSETGSDAALARSAIQKRGGPGAGPEVLLHRGLPDDFTRAGRLAVDNKRWWNSLHRDEQRAIVAIHPQVVGKAPGLPFEVANYANDYRRYATASAIRAKGRKNASRIERQVFRNLYAVEEALARSVTVHRDIPPPVVTTVALDPEAFGGNGSGTFVIGNCRLEEAEHVVWYVDGVDTRLQSAPTRLASARNLYEELVRADRSTKVAVVCWIGYEAPANNKEAWASRPELAEAGGRLFARDVLALRAVISARMSKLGYSYGTPVVAEGGVGGRLDGVFQYGVVVGSPGRGLRFDSATDASCRNTWVLAQSDDPVTGFGGDAPDARGRLLGDGPLGLGTDPATDTNATRVRAERGFPYSLAPFDGHGEYLQYSLVGAAQPTESLRHVAWCLAGRGDEVPTEQHRPTVHNPTAMHRVLARVVDAARDRRAPQLDAALPAPGGHPSHSDLRRPAGVAADGGGGLRPGPVEAAGAAAASSDVRVGPKLAVQLGKGGLADAGRACTDALGIGVNAIVVEVGRAAADMAALDVLCRSAAFEDAALSVEVPAGPAWSESEVRAKVAEIAATLKRHGIRGELHAFDRRVLTAAAELAPDWQRVAMVNMLTVAGKGMRVATGWMARALRPGAEKIDAILDDAHRAGATGVAIPYPLLSEDFVRQTTAAGMRLAVWGVTGSVRMRETLRMDVGEMWTRTTKALALLRAEVAESGLPIPAASESSTPPARSTPTAQNRPNDHIGSRPTGFTPEPGDRQQPAEDLTTRDEPTRPDPVHATREELAEWATQLSDHGLRTFLTRAQTEASAHIADVHRGQSPALEAAIATARVQTVLVIEQLHRSAAGGSGSLLAAADAATNVFEVIGALHLADTRSASYTHDLDVLTRFPERLRAVAELGAARFVDGSDWARVADECLLAGRDNGWDEELIQSLRALPAQATEFAAALTGSDRIFGDAGGRYIPNAYRAAMYYLTRSHDTDEAINRLRELDHAVAAAVVRLGSTRPATEAGLSLFQLRLDIHAAIASADGAVAPAMRSSAMRGLDHDPLLPQTIERIVLDLGALARHGSETPRSIRPTYTAYPIASEYLVGAYDEDIFPVIEALAFAMHGGDFIKSTGPSSELLRTGSDGVSFVMDQWGRFLAAIDHNSLLHLMSAMGDELAGWGTLFTDQNGRLDDPVRPYRVDEIFDPMGTAQLRDALTRGGLRLDDTNFDNASQGKLWRHDSTPVSALFTMEPLGFLGSIESMFAAYDDGFWIKPVRGGTTHSADEVRVPLILGPLRHEPGNLEVAVYRQGDQTIVRYRDPDPGPEPDRVAPVFAEFHQRMNRWVAESDGAEWHPDTAQVVHTFEQHLGRSVSGQDGPDGYIGSRPSDSAADSNDPTRRSKSGPADATDRPEPSGTEETTSLRFETDKVAETPDVKRIQTMQGRPGVTIELLTFEDDTHVLRETYDDVGQAMAEWTKAVIGQAIGAPIAEVRLDPPAYHVLYRDYVTEGARNNPRAVDLLGLFAAITGKPSPFAAAFVRDVGGRRVWQDHHLGRQDIVEIGRLVKSVGDSLAQIPFPPSISRTVLDTQMAAMSALREVAQHAEHPLRMAGLDEEAQAKTRLVANFELDHPYIELSGLVSPHIPADTVGEILDKLDDLLVKYRYAPGFRKLMTNIRVLEIDFVAGARATASSQQMKNLETGKLSPARTKLTFSLQYAADREKTVADSDRRRQSGSHPSSAQIYADDVCHEFAHAIDQAANYELSDNLSSVLIDAHGKLELYGLTESYVEWRSRLPWFAFEDSTKTRLDFREAIAVGFADAEINGLIVGTPQWVIHRYVTTLQSPEIKPEHLERSASEQRGPAGYIGSRPTDSAADPNDPIRRSSVVFGPDTPTSLIRASLAESLSFLGLDAASVEPPAGLLDIAACLVNYGIAAADGDSVKLLLSSRGSDKGFTVSGALSGSTVVRARRALESELLGKGFGTFEWRGRAGETDSWLVHLWGDRKSIVHVDPAQLAGLAEDFGADQVGSAVSAAVGRASRRWGGLKHTGSLAVELNDGRLRVRMLGIRLVDGLAYEPPTLFDETITRPGADRPGGFIGSRPSDSADAAGLSADLARNRADAAAQLRAAAQRFGEEPPVRGAEAAAIEAWQHARKASAATIATLTGTNPGLVMTQLSEVLNLLHRRLTALTQPEWHRLLSSGGQQLSTALGPWIGRSLRLEDDLQRATTLALEGTPDNALNNSNAERRTQRTRDLDDMLGRSATSSGVAANAGMDLPQALERLAASMEETPTGRLLNALLDHVRFARLIQLTTTWMELDGYITANFGRFETPEQSGGSSPEEGDRTSGLIGNRPQDQPGDAGPNNAEKSTPWSPG